MKAVNDANVLDPRGATRVREMYAILDALLTDQLIEGPEAEALERRIQKVFDLYKNDPSLKYPRVHNL